MQSYAEWILKREYEAIVVYKQVIVVRSDLKMSKGKLAAQVAHASLSATDKIDKKVLSAWKKEGQKKVILKVRGETELFELKAKCDSLKIPCSLTVDAGLTELAPGTATVLGIGPGRGEKINKVTGSLPLLK